jgi:hypothetical protein
MQRAKAIFAVIFAVIIFCHALDEALKQLGVHDEITQTHEPPALKQTFP